MTRSIFLLLSLTVLSSTLSAQSSDELIGKWEISAYIYWGIPFDPEDDEKNDYIEFYDDGTFKSYEKSTVETGTWRWTKRPSILALGQDGEYLDIEVVELNEDELIVLLEEDGDAIKVKYESRQ
ncbi:MAG: lipocalin family protein [Bacteroidota bacterium]